MSTVQTRKPPTVVTGVVSRKLIAVVAVVVVLLAIVAIVGAVATHDSTGTGFKVPVHKDTKVPYKSGELIDVNDLKKDMPICVVDVRDAHTPGVFPIGNISGMTMSGKHPLRLPEGIVQAIDVKLVVRDKVIPAPLKVFGLRDPSRVTIPQESRLLYGTCQSDKSTTTANV